MDRINEEEFVEIIKQLKGKDVSITLEAEIESRVTIYKMDYEVKHGIVKLIDRISNNYISINLSLAYKTLTNDRRDKVQANIDTMNKDIIITIETINVSVV